MDEETRLWCSCYWVAFKERQGRCPSRIEWEQMVREAAKSPEDPLCGPGEGRLGALALESFRTLDIETAMREDISLKFRAAFTNAYCRKYVDGSF